MSTNMLSWLFWLSHNFEFAEKSWRALVYRMRCQAHPKACVVFSSNLWITTAPSAKMSTDIVEYQSISLNFLEFQSQLVDDKSKNHEITNRYLCMSYRFLFYAWFINRWINNSIKPFFNRSFMVNGLWLTAHGSRFKAIAQGLWLMFKNRRAGLDQDPGPIAD